MNASFRTAFWAMCLGFTVPMVLFVGVELTTGGKARAQKTMGAADRRGSLLQQLAGRSAPHHAASATTTADPELATAERTGADGKVVLDGLEEDASDPHVVLGPGVESDPAAVGVSRPDRHIPANSVAESRPRAHIDPRIEPIPGPHAVAISGIEARLTDIQQNLAKLGRALETHSAPVPAADPVKQATEFLKQLQDAHLIQGPTPQPEPVAARTNQDETSAPAEPTEPERSVPEVYNPAPEVDAPELIPAPKPQTQIYRPRFLTGSALQALIQPLLTPHVGRIGSADMLAREPQWSSPAGTAIPADAVIVIDLPDVIEKIDALLQKLDTPAEKVVVEAVILSVQLGSERPHGIDLLEFNNAGQPFTVTTTEGGVPGAASSSRESSGVIDDPLLLTRRYGLKRGILNGDPQAFLSALQSAAPVRRTDAWQVTIVSRQLANLMLGDPFGAGGSADSSTAATILGIRPIITREGVVHLDVRQDVGIDLAAAAGNRSAALSHQFTLYPGQTAVIGGFYADQAITQCYRPPVIGSIPLFGRLFCREMNGIDRAETIVLLTPHVLSTQSDLQLTGHKRHTPKTSGRAILGEQNQTIIPVSGTAERPARKRRPVGR